MSALPDCLGLRAQAAIQALFAVGVRRVYCVRYEGFRRFGADCLCVAGQQRRGQDVELLLCPFKTRPDALDADP